jgi:hypothetical protein
MIRVTLFEMQFSLCRGIRASFGLAKPYVPYVAKGEEQSALLQKEE